MERPPIEGVLKKSINGEYRDPATVEELCRYALEIEQQNKQMHEILKGCGTRNLYRELVNIGYKPPANWREMDDIALRDDIIIYLSGDDIFIKETFSRITELMETYRVKEFTRAINRVASRA